jgi:hypothetical protein
LNPVSCNNPPKTDPNAPVPKIRYFTSEKVSSMKIKKQLHYKKIPIMENKNPEVKKIKFVYWKNGS